MKLQLHAQSTSPLLGNTHHSWETIKQAAIQTSHHITTDQIRLFPSYKVPMPLNCGKNCALPWQAHHEFLASLVMIVPGDPPPGAKIGEVGEVMWLSHGYEESSYTFQGGGGLMKGSSKRYTTRFTNRNELMINPISAIRMSCYCLLLSKGQSALWYVDWRCSSFWKLFVLRTIQMSSLTSGDVESCSISSRKLAASYGGATPDVVKPTPEHFSFTNVPQNVNTSWSELPPFPFANKQARNKLLADTGEIHASYLQMAP